MPARRKFLFSFLIAIITLLLLPKVVHARVVINEFSSYGNSDWVEIYRTQTENLSLYYLEDEAGNTKQLSWSDCNGDFCPVDWSNKLNNSGDVIKLFLGGYPLPQDQIAYGDIEGSVVVAPGEGQSAGRITDGAGTWVIFSPSTKGSTNDTGTPVPTNPPTPTPTLIPTQTPTNTPIPTSTPTPLSTKATYKINGVIDEEGDVLSSVKIYVDGVYVHHYAPETLEFCDGCQCDGYVNCGFGEHTIKLEKNDYQDWSETKTISSGDSYEVNPVMELSTPTSTLTPTLTPTPRPTSAVNPTPTPTKKLTPTPTFSGEVLGATKSGEATFSSHPEEGKDEEKELEEKGGSSSFLWPKVIIGLGLVLIIGASYPLWLPRCSALLKICSRRRTNEK